MDQGTNERIQRVWDRLADFDASRSDDALDYLLTELCAIVDAQNANWMGALRMPNILPGDPVQGWRPHAVRFLHPSRPLDDKVKEQIESLEQGNVDETTVRSIALAGTFRVNRLVDLVPEAWFDSPYYRCYYSGVGHTDAIWAAVPVNEDAEAHLGIFRDAQHPRFSADDCRTVAYTLRGLKWFHRQQMLSHGALVARTPLTPVERQILQRLLTGQSEKQIAAAQGQSYHTTHEYVSSIFRKFGVTNRAGLMALWLGNGAQSPPV